MIRWVLRTNRTMIISWSLIKAKRELDLLPWMIEKFLIIFYNSTLVVSASTTLNAHKCYSEIVNITSSLKLLCNSYDAQLKVKAEEMSKKFEKYWDGVKNINKMLIVASIFDPSRKMKFTKLCFEEL